MRFGAPFIRPGLANKWTNQKWQWYLFQCELKAQAFWEPPIMWPLWQPIKKICKPVSTSWHFDPLKGMPGGLGRQQEVETQNRKKRGWNQELGALWSRNFVFRAFPVVPISYLMVLISCEDLTKCERGTNGGQIKSVCPFYRGIVVSRRIYNCNQQNIWILRRQRSGV